MNEFFSDKKRIAGFIIVIILIVSFFSRGIISRIVDFGSKKIQDISRTGEKPFSGDNRVPQKSDPKDTDAAEKNPMIPPKPQPAARPAVPPYHGRDPAEVRPNPKYVASFNAGQKNDLYVEIKNTAKTLEDAPDYAQAWLELGLLKKTIGDFEGSRDAWEYAALLRPAASLPFRNLGQLYWHYLPDFTRAERNLKKAIANDTTDSDGYAMLADFYTMTRKDQASLAENVLLQGIERVSENTNLMRSLASFYQQNGMYQKSLDWWQKVGEKEPNNTAVKTTIKELKEKIGTQ